MVEGCLESEVFGKIQPLYVLETRSLLDGGGEEGVELVV